MLVSFVGSVYYPYFNEVRVYIIDMSFNDDDLHKLFTKVLILNLWLFNIPILIY